MPDRFGLDQNGDGLIDYDYSPPYLRATTFDVVLDACASTGGSTPIVSFEWAVATVPPRTVSSSTCKTTLRLPEGTFSTTLTARAQDGSAGSLTKSVAVKDTLFVSIGDSIASGEGDPDKSQTYDSLGFVKAGPVWQHRRCHRSAQAGPARAAIDLERSDPRSTVTFVSVACSGASIPEGLLGVYAGIEPGSPLQAAQVLEVERLLCSTSPFDPTIDEKCPGFLPTIDVMTISDGGNDIHFSTVIENCVYVPYCGNDIATTVPLQADLDQLPAAYDRLASAIARRLDPARVFVTEYPNEVTDETGQPCFIFGVAISTEESKWAAAQLIGRLNDTVQQAAVRHGWRYVGDIARQFVGHGYCAGDSRWIRTFEDSRTIQGPFGINAPPGGNFHDTKGMFHPNVSGQSVYAGRIGGEIRTSYPRLIGDLQTVTGDSDGDGVFEPGEAFKIEERVVNTGTIAATRAQARPQTSEAGVSFLTTTAYPDLIPGEKGTASFPGRLAPTFPCGANVTATIEISTRQDRSFTVPVSFSTGSAGQIVDHSSTDVPQVVPPRHDVEGPTGLTVLVPSVGSSSITVPNEGIVKKIRVRIGRITAPADETVEVSLVAPNRSLARLILPGDAAGSNFVDTVFEDSATKQLAGGAAPYSGTFRPAGGLSSLTGATAQGTWKLQVTNHSDTDAVSISSWGAGLAPAVCG
jgi:subtilisin-like proprotein convertase family protein